MKMHLYHIELHTRDGKVELLDTVLTNERRVARAVARGLQDKHRDGNVSDRWVGVVENQCV